MVKAINALEALRHHGVFQGDFAPRNILCSGHDLGSALLRVVIIDFNRSRVRRLAGLPDNRSKLPVSPIVRYRRGCLAAFSPGWVPFEQEALEEWLWKHWGDSPSYEPVVCEADTPPLHSPSA